MSKQYQTPPLREAVCEFRFKQDSTWDLAIPGLIYAELAKDFPKRLPSTASGFDASFEIGPAGVRQQINRIEQLKFWRNDDAGAIRLSPHVLSISHFRPYPSWNGFLPIVEQALEAYWEVAKPGGIQRIGLRYINDLTFDESSVDLKDYLNFYPHSGDLDDYFACVVGIQIEYSEARDVLRVQMTNKTRTDVELPLELVLDLDYYLEVPMAVAYSEVTSWLEVAHERIEEAFESCLTDALRSRFKEGG